MNSSWAVRVNRRELVELQVDGTHGSAVAGLRHCTRPAPRRHAHAGVEPGPARPDRLSAPSGPRSRTTGVRQRLQGPVGAVPAGRSRPARRSPGTWPRAPRACSSPSSRCSPRPRGAGWTCPELPRERAGHPPVALPGRTPSRSTSRTPPLGRRGSPAAAHVVADPRPAHVAARPDGSIDWEATLAFREYLWAHGFGGRRGDGHRAARHGAGLGRGPGADPARPRPGPAGGGLIACGAGTDQLPPGPHPLPAIVGAVRGAARVGPGRRAPRSILMASRALAASARSARDYLERLRPAC